jgi:mannosyltransferase OCH1-like enzyme
MKICTPPIPKIIHFVWVGNESKCPHHYINTWRDLNPEWGIKIWGNKEYNEYPWRNKFAMQQMWNREKSGVADIMRYEILYNEGGLALDADSACVYPLEDWLFNVEAFAVWENELDRPGLIATGAMASRPRNSFFKAIIEDIYTDRNIGNGPAWATTGPVRITNNYKQQRYINLTIWPSYFFIPKHHTDTEYTGPGSVFSTQKWGSTFNSYNDLNTESKKK